MKLYMHPVSMTSRPVRLFIAENKIPVEEELIDLMTGAHLKPPYSTINPNCLVPMIEDGDFRLTESSAILKYLADKIGSPAYPKDLLAKSVEGHATLRFVVDSTGLIDLGTVRLVEASHPLFLKAVEDAMPRMRFRPAMMGHSAVRQLAEQLFKFEIKKPPATARLPQ